MVFPGQAECQTVWGLSGVTKSTEQETCSVLCCALCCVVLCYAVLCCEAALFIPKMQLVLIHCQVVSVER